MPDPTGIGLLSDMSVAQYQEESEIGRKRMAKAEADINQNYESTVKALRQNARSLLDQLNEIESIKDQIRYHAAAIKSNEKERHNIKMELLDHEMAEILGADLHQRRQEQQQRKEIQMNDKAGEIMHGFRMDNLTISELKEQQFNIAIPERFHQDLLEQIREMAKTYGKEGRYTLLVNAQRPHAAANIQVLADGRYPAQSIEAEIGEDLPKTPKVHSPVEKKQVAIESEQPALGHVEGKTVKEIPLPTKGK